jgi:hypothetical protein
MGRGWQVSPYSPLSAWFLKLIYHSLDDFIDIRLGRKTAHIHMHRLSSTLSSAPSSPASSTKDLPNQPTTPTLMSEKGKRPQLVAETQQPHHAPSAQEDPHSRSARIRAFRAYQRAPPEEKERMRREMEETTGASASGAPRTEWTPVHLLSAQEVKSLFRDVVEGLSFLVIITFGSFWTYRVIDES